MLNFVISAAWDALFASIAGLGFAYICNTPKHTLLLSAILAAIGHSCRWFLINFWSFNIVLATFVASFFVGIIGVFMAKKAKTPIEIISFPALLPMIPGIYAYKSILTLFTFIKSSNMATKEKCLVLFFENMLSTTMISIALAVGVSIALLLFHEELLMVTRHSKDHFIIKNIQKVKEEFKKDL